jgi:hypothetical protein
VAAQLMAEWEDENENAAIIAAAMERPMVLSPVPRPFLL